MVQSELELKQDLIDTSSDITAGSLSVFTKKMKSPEELNALIFRLIEQYFSPSYKPTNNAVFRAAVTYFFDNTLGLPAGTNNTQPSINNMTKWDVSAVSSFDAVFATRSDFNENISAWDVSLVTTFSVAFFDCLKFNQPIGNWIVSKVTNMFLTFQGCHLFNQDINGWNVSNVLEMHLTFSSCFSYNQPMGNWNVSKVTDMYGMFQLCSVFDQDISGWNVSNVTDIRYMFKNAPLFYQDIRAWKISNVSNARLLDMFAAATAMLEAYPTLTTATGIRNWFNSTDPFIT